MKEYIEREALLARYDAEHVGLPGRARELIATAPADIVEEDTMAQPTLREQIVECSEAMENGMITVARTRGIWQNDLIWYICKAVKLLLDEQLKHK